MILEEKIRHTLWKEGVFDDYKERATQRGATPQDFAATNASLRARLDKIMGKTSTPKATKDTLKFIKDLAPNSAAGRRLLFQDLLAILLTLNPSGEGWKKLLEETLDTDPLESTGRKMFNNLFGLDEDQMPALRDDEQMKTEVKLWADKMSDGKGIRGILNDFVRLASRNARGGNVLGDGGENSNNQYVKIFSRENVQPATAEEAYKSFFGQLEDIVRNYEPSGASKLRKHWTDFIVDTVKYPELSSSTTRTSQDTSTTEPTEIPITDPNHPDFDWGSL